MSNNAAERAIRPLASEERLSLRRRRCRRRAAVLYTIIETAKLNGLDPEAYLADILARIADHPAKRIDQLLPLAVDSVGDDIGSGRMSTDAIVRLKVTLDDVKPAVMRRLEVPLNLRLDRLHLVLQAAIGWTNSHLWEIRVRDIGWGP